MKKTPSEGQKLAIEFSTRNPYSILALPPGQGKTLCAVEVSLKLGLNTLVVCPSYAKNVWVDEFTCQKEDIELIVFDDSESIHCPWDKDVAIMSYSLLNDRRKSVMAQRNDFNDKQAEKLFEWADLVIWDEAHMLKTITTKMAQVAHKLVYENSTKYVMMLSGTPAKNRVEELYSLILLTTYEVNYRGNFPTKYPSVADFAEKFSFPQYHEVSTRRGKKLEVTYSGIRNEKELGDILRPIYFTLPDHLLEKLPEQTIIDVRVGNEVKGEWEEFEKWVKDNGKTTPDIKAKAAAITAPFTVEYCKGLLNNVERVVVFTDHIEACDIIARGLGVQPIHSKVDMKVRKKTLEDFQAGKTAAIVATIGTLSTAIQLTISQDMILNDPPWVPGDLEQAMKRIRRRGQKNHCTYHRILGTKQTARIYKKVEEKQEVLDKIKEIVK